MSLWKISNCTTRSRINSISSKDIRQWYVKKNFRRTSTYVNKYHWASIIGKRTHNFFLCTLWKWRRWICHMDKKRSVENVIRALFYFLSCFLFLLCTFLLMAALESYRLSMDLNIRIKNYYIAKIMKQMALSEQSTLAESSEGVFTTQLDL